MEKTSKNWTELTKSEKHKVEDWIRENTEIQVMLGLSYLTTPQVTLENDDFDLYYDGTELKDYLEIDQDVREKILLNFPMKVLCKPGCKGLCPNCGVNLNYQECKCQQAG